MFFIVLRAFGEDLGVQLPGQIFDSGDKAGSGTVDGVADRGVTAIAHSVQESPAGKARQSIGATWP